MIKKLKVALVILGHSSRLFDERKIRRWKSKIFEVSSVHRIETLPESNLEDFYLDQKFEPDQLSELVVCPPDCDLAIGIMAYRFVDNFYMHKINLNCVVVSIYGISEILSTRNISMENFVLKQFYVVAALKLIYSDISTGDVYSFVHRDTRGCIFDLNGDRQDIVHNTEQPGICESCRAVLNTRQIPEDSIGKYSKELKLLRKPLIQEVEIFVKKYPLVSLLGSGILAVLLNLLASMIWESFK